MSDPSKIASASVSVLQGWQGMLTAIREITYDAESASLLLYPIKELSQLRGRTLYDGTETLHRTTSSTQVNMLLPSILMSWSIKALKSLVSFTYTISGQSLICTLCTKC